MDRRGRGSGANPIVALRPLEIEKVWRTFQLSHRPWRDSLERERKRNFGGDTTKNKLNFTYEEVRYCVHLPCGSHNPYYKQISYHGQQAYRAIKNG